MMPTNREEEISRLRNEARRIAILEAPGAIMVGLALFGIFNKGSQALHPLLDDPVVTTGMLIVGGVIMAWATWRVIPVTKRMAELRRGSSS